jgi:hypothetical protein
VIDETKELFTAPRGERADELSDVMYGVGRLVGSVLGREYVRMPFDAAHRKKISERMEAYGCIRSRRWLVAGRCPSENQ